MDAACNHEKWQLCYSLIISYLQRTSRYAFLGLPFSAFHRSARIPFS
jgi:hypothetical protein